MSREVNLSVQNLASLARPNKDAFCGLIENPVILPLQPAVGVGSGATSEQPLGAVTVISI